jgi:carboxypeptidase C (cathepsin A)
MSIDVLLHSIQRGLFFTHVIGRCPAEHCSFLFSKSANVLDPFATPSRTRPNKFTKNSLSYENEAVEISIPFAGGKIMNPSSNIVSRTFWTSACQWSLLLLCACSLFTGAFGADSDKDGSSKKQPEPKPKGKVFVTKHSGRIGGATMSYTATAGTMLMKNDKDEPNALFGFTAYVDDASDPSTRPIIFAYNGGPGSSSIWLHMGVLGPKRTDLADLESNTRGPFRIVDNEASILEQADLVLIDPVGTGLSRPVGHADGKDFWGVDQDVASVANFIVQYLSEYGRWASPKFILGESYGGMRSGGLSLELLKKHNVALNGVILVSPYLDFASGTAGLRMDDPYINFLPTYAATAWYHNALPNRPPELQPFLREAEAFAENVYAPVLFKGHRASATERHSVLDGLVRFTGISADYWEKADLRIDESRFLQELLRRSGKVVGRIDTRYRAPILRALSETTLFDPFDSAIGTAIVASFNDYYRRELKVDTDRQYVPASDLWKNWDERHQQPDMGDYKVPFANTAVDLCHVLSMNPKMKILIHQGYFDLAVPYRSVEYVLDHLDLPPELRSNIRIEYYEAGHMMYVHAPSREKFKKVSADFINANLR